MARFIRPGKWEQEFTSNESASKFLSEALSQNGDIDIRVQARDHGIVITVSLAKKIKEKR